MADKYSGTPKPDEQSPIDWLKPQSEQHAYVLQYLTDRIRFSEQKMSRFHPRWRNNEMMLQAYISLNDFDQMLKNMDSAEPGTYTDAPVAINVPFAWATVNTIVTYLLHMFAGRRPIFGVGSYRAEQVRRAKNMEMYLQYNADVVKFIRALYFFLMDGETYGLAVIRTLWKQERKSRIIQVPPSPDIAQVAQAMGRQASPTQQKQEYICFEGSSCTNVDPFMFFPDPRVPMHEVNEKGEWVSWRAFMGRHQLLKEQALGRLKYVDKVDPERWAQQNLEEGIGSARGIRALGDADPGRDSKWDSRIAPHYQVDQGTFEIIAKDLGLGDSEVPEKWMFTILNKTQIVQAMPVELPSGKHPIVVAEPNSVGYGFGNLGTVDMLGPMQSMMSWFMNSHIYNVRAALNNMFVVDPTKVEMQDFKNPAPGKLIRLKNTAFGLSDPKNAIQQLQVTDVTRSHLQDFQMFGKLAADLTGATDNVRGLQDQGGRKTATEVRTSSEAGTSRLAAKGKNYSSMAFTDLAEIWSANAQSNLSSEFEISILGQEGADASIRISPGDIQGDFVFPVHDGTLPIDKLAMLDVWKEIYMAVSQDPQLRQSYDMLEMFDWMAQLGGAQNIKSFRLNMVSQGTQAGALSGQGPLSAQGIPMQQVMAAMAQNGGR